MVGVAWRVHTAFTVLFFTMYKTSEITRRRLQPPPEVLTQALGQGAVPGAFPLTGDGAGAQQVVARVTAVRHGGLEAVAMRPAGQYLPDAVLHMARLCAVHDWRNGQGGAGE